MTKALDIFADSYFRSLKRPELLNFNPDQAYGANSVFGSNEQNPWANRNQDNAKFGQLGGTGSIAKATSMTPANFGNLGPTGNTPQAQNIFSTLLGGATRVGENTAKNYLSDAAVAKLKELFTSPVDQTVKETTSNALTHMLSGTTPMSPVERAVAQSIAGEAPLSGVEKAVESFGDKAVNEGIESGLSGAESSVPVAGPAMRLGKDFLTGDIIRNPAKSIGGAGGAMAGGALGSMILPGPGTVVGSVIGSMLGDTLGGLLGGKKKRSEAKPMPIPDIAPQASSGGLNPTQEQYLTGSPTDYENTDWNDWLSRLFSSEY